MVSIGIFKLIELKKKDELFEKARGEVLDEVVNLAQIKSKEWEDSLNRLLLEESANYIFNNIYMPAAQKESLGFVLIVFFYTVKLEICTY